MRILSRSTAAASLLAIAMAIALPRTAAAEPIAITSGNMETQIINGVARVLFEGDAFLLQLGVEGFRASIAMTCSPCTPGSTVDLGGAFDLPTASGRALVDGVTYPTIFADGMTGTFTTPSVQINGSTTTTVTLPFSFSGTVNGYLLDPFVHGLTEPAFTKMLTGRGTATATFAFTDEDGPLFSTNFVRYDFTDAAPVPEPATMLLCGLGCALLGVRRRKAHQEN
jgi:hypothetical protein